MTRPAVDRDRILGQLAKYGMFLVDHPVIALGVPGGLTKAGKNTIGGFDDLLVVLTGDLCEGFTGNTDPSTEIPNRANLVPGIHWFQPGLHHPGTPKEYAAFVQDGSIIVRRWQTEDVTRGTKDERGECLSNGLWKGEFEIHLHDAKGVNTTGSEGCQTVITTEWPSYQTLLLDELLKTVPPELRSLPVSDLVKRGLLRFPYVLVDPNL